MIDIPNQLTGTLGPAHKIKFRAAVIEEAFGKVPNNYSTFYWFIEQFDPRIDRPGYTASTVSNRHDSSELAMRQLTAYLGDLGADIHEKGLASYWAEPEVPVTIDKEDHLRDAGVITPKDRTANERQRRHREAVRAARMSR